MAMTDVATPRRRKPARAPIRAELRLGGWAARGAAGADLDGSPVLIARGIPGERVEVAIDLRSRPRRGIVETVLEPSPDRVSAPCPFFHRGCGGCQWQHLSYQAQLAAKRETVNREMRRAGLSITVDAVHSMADPWRYRRTAAIALGWEAGFRPIGRRGIVQIDDCLIAHPLIGSLADQLNELLSVQSLPNYHGKLWLDCTVVGDEDSPALQVLIQGITGLTLESHPELPEVANRIAGLNGVATVAFRHRSGQPVPLIGDLCSSIAVEGRSMFLPAGSFFQTNLEMLAVLLGAMRQALQDQGIGHLVDIYGGVGTFALNLADPARHVTLIELDSLAVEAARRTAGSRGLDNFDFVAAHAERALHELPDVDLAVVDPPRSGLGSVVTAALADKNVPTVFYVSCAPSSLATDLADLRALGYRVRSLELFDFYPQTYHVESFAILER
jgi:23S rRNA (uracil1939-C5)-methyltransferase